MKQNPLLSDKKALRAALRERVSATYAHYLAEGERTPGRAVALWAEAELGIPVSWWDDNAKRASRSDPTPTADTAA